MSALSNPQYVSHLGSKGLFSDRAFREWCDYLQYWKRPEYVVFLPYPTCLKHLDMILTDTLPGGGTGPPGAGAGGGERDWDWDKTMAELHKEQAAEWLDRCRVYHGEGSFNGLDGLIERERDPKARRDLEERRERVLRERERLGI